jgi:hypothetical protein
MAAIWASQCKERRWEEMAGMAGFETFGLYSPDSVTKVMLRDVQFPPRV